MDSQADVIAIVQRFAKAVQEVMTIDQLYLFGSWAAGTAGPYSDIDVAIVSPEFTGFRFDDRHRVNPVILQINSSIEPHPFRNDDFNDGDPLAREIIKTGIRVI